MQVGKSSAELNPVSIHGDRAEGGFVLLLDIIGKIPGVHTQKPPDTRLLQVKEPGCLILLINVHHILLNIPKDPGKHVEKMYADVGGYPTRLLLIPLPGYKIPVAPGGNISQINIINLVFRTFIDLSLQFNDRGMQPQLQDVVHLSSGLFLYLDQSIQIPGIQNYRLLTDGIRSLPQGKTNMRIMQIIRCANAYIIDPDPLTF